MGTAAGGVLVAAPCRCRRSRRRTIVELVCSPWRHHVAGGAGVSDAAGAVARVAAFAPFGIAVGPAGSAESGSCRDGAGRRRRAGGDWCASRGGAPRPLFPARGSRPPRGVVAIPLAAACRLISLTRRGVLASPPLRARAVGVGRPAGCGRCALLARGPRRSRSAPAGVSEPWRASTLGAAGLSSSPPGGGGRRLPATSAIGAAFRSSPSAPQSRSTPRSTWWPRVRRCSCSPPPGSPSLRSVRSAKARRRRHCCPGRWPSTCRTAARIGEALPVFMALIGMPAAVVSLLDTGSRATILAVAGVALGVIGLAYGTCATAPGAGRARPCTVSPRTWAWWRGCRGVAASPSRIHGRPGAFWSRWASPSSLWLWRNANRIALWVGWVASSAATVGRLVAGVRPERLHLVLFVGAPARARSAYLAVGPAPLRPSGGGALGA